MNSAEQQEQAALHKAARMKAYATVTLIEARFKVRNLLVKHSPCERCGSFIVQEVGRGERAGIRCAHCSPNNKWPALLKDAIDDIRLKPQAAPVPAQTQIEALQQGRDNEQA